MWGRIGTLTPINIIFYLRSYLVVLLSQKEGHWKDEWPTLTRIHCVWTNMGHSRTIFIVAVILRSVRYSKLHTGELACQQILFIETCGREKKKLSCTLHHPVQISPSSPLLLTSFCTFSTPFTFIYLDIATSIPYMHPLFHTCRVSLLLTFLAVAHRAVCLFERMLFTLWLVAWWDRQVSIAQ